MSDWAKIFGAEEWAYIQKLGSAIHDPADKREWWENVKRLKMENPAFSIYELFPKEAKPKNDAQELADRYCKPIIERLKGTDAAE